MRILISILFPFSIIQMSNAQIKKSDAAYYYKTYLAERQIINQSFDSALYIYQEAFKVRKPFCVDIYNAAVCAIYINNVKATFDLCDSLSHRGVGSGFFSKGIFHACATMEPKRWANLLSSAAKNNYRLRKETNSVMKTIDSLINWDQEWNNYRLGIRQSDSLSNEIKDSLEKVTWKGVQKISKAANDFFIKQGYPSEFEIGPNITNDTTLINLPKFWTILVHNYQGFNQTDSLFSALLKMQLYKGKIKPEQFALIQDLGNINFERPYYGTSKMYWEINSHLYTYPSYRSGIYADFIERCRASIGLPNISEVEKMLIQISNNPELFGNFVFTMQATKLGASSDKELSSFTQGMQKIK